MASWFGVPSGFVYSGPCFFIPSVSKLQPVLKPSSSTATNLPCVDPTYSIPPTIAGDEYKYQWFSPIERSTAPDLASTSYTRLVSEVAKYTFPSRTAGVATIHDPFAPNAHFFSPVLASSA